jgi:hypothetical protein
MAGGASVAHARASVLNAVPPEDFIDVRRQLRVVEGQAADAP